jgi:hypothetical protein
MRPLRFSLNVHGPTLFAGLRERLELRLVDRKELRSGAQVLRDQPRKRAG